MSSGRMNWWPKDEGWWRRTRIARVGMKFGPLAPAVLDWLTCEAKAQSPGQSDQEGWVKTGYAAVAVGATFCKCDPDDDIRPVVEALVEAGALDDFEADEDDPDKFVCRISGWRNDVYLPLEAARSQAKRNAKKAATEPSSDDQDRPMATDDDQQQPPASPTGRGRGTDTSSLREDERGGGLPTIRHNRQRVPDARHRLALDVLAAFNAALGSNLGAYKGSGGPSPALSSILTFLTDAAPENPPTLDECKAMIDHALKDPYWGRRAMSANIFGPNTGPANLDAVRADGGATSDPTRAGNDAAYWDAKRAEREERDRRIAERWGDPADQTDEEATAA